MSVTIHWFRYDLRLSDNPALTTAARTGKVVPVYILEDQIGKDKDQTPSGLQQSHAMGAATKLWLHFALSSLQSDLQDKLVLRRGSAEHILWKLIDETGAQQVTMTRCYAPHQAETDRKIEQKLQQKGIKISI